MKLHGPRWGMKNSDKQKEAVRLYMKNRVVSLETRKKLGASKIGNKNCLGKKYPYKSRPQMVGRLAGEKSPHWKGGITPKDRLERLKFRETIQKEVLKRDNYSCQLCGSTGDLQVDHIQSWADYVDLRFSMDNCRTLCMGCHYKITFGKSKPKDIVWGYNLGRARVSP
ncbi:MAG: HNH endonuclease [Candidatus Scalindua sp.]|nr:HNH endonuclease [Candidatus Scalindua sp.]